MVKYAAYSPTSVITLHPISPTARDATSRGARNDEFSTPTRACTYLSDRPQALPKRLAVSMRCGRTASSAEPFIELTLTEMDSEAPAKQRIVRRHSDFVQLCALIGDRSPPSARPRELLAFCNAQLSSLTVDTARFFEIARLQLQRRRIAAAHCLQAHARATVAARVRWSKEAADIPPRIFWPTVTV